MGLLRGEAGIIATPAAVALIHRKENAGTGPSIIQLSSPPGGVAMPKARRARPARPGRRTPPAITAPTIDLSGSADREEAGHLWTALGQEIGRFPQSRAQACMHAAQQMTHCHSLPDAWQLQAKFVQESLREYLDESGRLAEIWTQACFRTWSGLQRR